MFGIGPYRENTIGLTSATRDTQLVLDHRASPRRGTPPLIPLITTPPPGFDTTLEPNDTTFLNIQVRQVRLTSSFEQFGLISKNQTTSHVSNILPLNN
jgi:hypothetical protein